MMFTTVSNVEDISKSLTHMAFWRADQ